jgi:hypothetical protein
MKATKDKRSSSPITLDLKYSLYENSVQNADGEIETLQTISKLERGKLAKVLREDFCGTGLLTCAWVKQGPQYQSIGLDLDPVPLSYGHLHHYEKLSAKEKKQVQMLECNVLDAPNRPVDLVAALNFSYFIFKSREMLKLYFKSVFDSLPPGALFVLDLFGGTEAQSTEEEETDHDDFTYYWECQKFDPMTHECFFAIHFRPKGRRKLTNVFTYDWRLWTMPELKDLLLEVGFKRVTPYWEGDDDDGGGNGDFRPVKGEIENCLSWVAYLAAIK